MPIQPQTLSPVSGEMSLAGSIQALLLPRSSPVCTWCCMGVKNRMASTLGGDFYDFIEMPDGCQALFLGDVTGHGVQASVVMSLVYGFLHRAAQESCDPREAVSALNHFLRSFAVRSAQLDHHFSATLFYGVIEPETLRMNYVNAGHPAALVRRDGELLRLPATSHPIGYFDDPQFLLSSCEFALNDRLLLYTDGLVDCMNRQGEMFGARRLQTYLSEGDSDHFSFLEGLFANVDRFLAGEHSFDDQTAIVIDFHQPR